MELSFISRTRVEATSTERLETTTQPEVKQVWVYVSVSEQADTATEAQAIALESIAQISKGKKFTLKEQNIVRIEVWREHKTVKVYKCETTGWVLVDVVVRPDEEFSDV